MWSDTNRSKLINELSDKQNKQPQSEKNIKDIKQHCGQSSTDSGYMSSEIKSSDNLLQPQSEKIIDDNDDIKQHCSKNPGDSGFFSDEIQSSDSVMLANVNIEHNVKNKDILNMKPLKETICNINNTIDSNFDVQDNKCCVVLEDTFKPDEHDWRLYFQQNEDGDTYVHILFSYIFIYKNHFGSNIILKTKCRNMGIHNSFIWWLFFLALANIILS